MPLPPPLPQSIQYLFGEPVTIVLVFTGVDVSDKQFISQIRQTANAATVLETFHVTKLYDGDDTTVIFTLNGDTALGQTNGETRTLGNAAPSAVFDIQMADEDGTLERTIVGPTDILGTSDVTR